MKKERIIKFDDIGIQKQKFHQQKGSISIKNIDINKIVVCDKVSFGKNGFKYFIGCKEAKKLDLYVNFCRRLVHIEDNLMKLNIYLF